MCKNFCDNDNCQSCFEKSFKSNPRSSFWSENNNISPRMVYKNSPQQYEFRCNTCFHYFRSRLNDITSNFSWCPYCGKRILCDNNECIICFEKSFASHPKSSFWSENNKINSRSVFRWTRKKYEFKCNICFHYFTTNVMSVNKKSWCPYCSHTKLCGNKDCKMCFENSLASHPFSQHLTKNNNFNPINIFKHSKTKCEIKCDKCDHSYTAKISNLTKKNRPTGCPYCSPTRKILCGIEDCKKCFEKSFASHPRSLFLVDKHINCLKICKGSNIKLQFKCENEHIFSSYVSGVTSLNKNMWCPKCKHKVEKKFYDWLINKYNDSIHQYKPEWIRSVATKKFMPFDFFIPSLNIIIEIDGDQHFRQIWNWRSPEETQKIDLHKMVEALKQNITIIRIPYNHIYRDNDFSFTKSSLKSIFILREEPKIFLFVDSETDNRYSHVENFDFGKIAE